jgi:hypothetical protein
MRSFIIMTFILFSLPGTSQDKVVTLNGDTINCQILEFNGIALTYKPSSTDTVCYMSGSQIYQLLYSDGQLQNVSKRIVITGKDDWKKVILTSDTVDVIGLVKVGDLKTTTYADYDKEEAREEGEKKLRKEAAALGSFIVLITYQKAWHPLLTGKTYFEKKAVFKASAYTYRN